MPRIVQSPVKHKRHSFSLFSPGDFFIHLEANFSVWWWGDKAPFKCLLHTASGSSSFYGLSMLRNDCDDKRKMLLVAGLEGTAAAQASDFAFTKFHFLRRALLVHGHWFVVVIVVIILVIIKPGIMFESVFWSSIPFTRTLPASLARCCHHLWHKSDPRSFISRCFTCSTPTSALRYFLAWSLWNCKHVMLQTLFESTFLVLYNTIYTSIPGLLFSEEHKRFWKFPLKKFLIAKLLLAMKVILDDHWPMMTIPSHPIRSTPIPTKGSCKKTVFLRSGWP